MSRSLRRAIATFTIVLTSGLVAFSGAASAQNTVESPVGPDTGYSVVIDFSGDLDGSLEHCGCHRHPMGGHIWRAGYVEMFAKSTSGQVPLLQVDAGHALASTAGPNGLTDEARVKNDYVLRSFDGLRMAAANVSYRDVAYLAERMRAADFTKTVKEFPALETFVSANLTPSDATIKPFKPYVIREVKGARLGAKPLRIGFLGLTEAPPSADGIPTTQIGAYRIVDPGEAARRYVPELRKSCDLVVVLGYVDRDTAQRIGLEAPGIDLILSARQHPFYTAVDEAGDAVIAYVANQTKWLGEIRLFGSGTGKGAAISTYEFRNVGLDDAIPDEPVAKKLVEESRIAIAKTMPNGTTPGTK